MAVCLFVLLFIYRDKMCDWGWRKIEEKKGAKRKEIKKEENLSILKLDFFASRKISPHSIHVIVIITQENWKPYKNIFCAAHFRESFQARKKKKCLERAFWVNFLQTDNCRLMWRVVRELIELLLFIIEFNKQAIRFHCRSFARSPFDV